MSETISTVSDEDFESAVVRADVPVLVDFWAEWCAPCHILSPILEEIARDHPGRIKVMKMNVDDSPQVSMKLRVQTIPTLMLFKDGEVMARISGVRGKDAILKEIEAFVPA
jgi:thioredoxin 1